MIEADETPRADLGVCVCNVHTHACNHECGGQCGHQTSFLADFHLMFCNSLSLNLELIWLGCLASERQGPYSSFQSPGVTDTCCHTWLLGVLDIPTWVLMLAKHTQSTHFAEPGDFLGRFFLLSHPVYGWSAGSMLKSGRHVHEGTCLHALILGFLSLPLTDVG